MGPTTTVAGIFLPYVADAARAAEATDLVPKEGGSFGMRVTLIPFDGAGELGRTEIDGVTVASRGQVILDAYESFSRTYVF